MITALQQSAGATAALDSWGTRVSGSRYRTGAGDSSGEGTGLPLKPARAQTLHAGFGDGTVSVPEATIRTLGKGLEGARRVVPSLEELRQQQRARLAEQRRAVAKAASQESTADGARGTRTTERMASFGSRRQEAEPVADKVGLLTVAEDGQAARPKAGVQTGSQTGNYSRTGFRAGAEPSPEINLFA